MDLKKAINSSICERSLDKIHNYFEHLLFGDMDLDSETVSILLKYLETDGNDSKAFSIKCVLTCLKKFLQVESPSSLWEQLSENIGKICEASFCISVKLKDKELIEDNISVLEEIIKVNQNLTNHICGYLLDPCLTALFVYHCSADFDLLFRLANLTSLLLQKTSRMKRNEIVPTVVHNLNSLPKLVISYGDYEIQAAIMEIIARCNSSIVPSSASLGSNEMLNLFSCSEKFGEEFKKYSFVNFEPDCRLFLNALNKSLIDKRKVHSIPCMCVVHNGINLEKPKDPNYKAFWVDFNIESKQISFYHEPSENNWTIKRVSFDEVVKVIAKDTVCGTKKSNKNIKSVKAEFSINCKSDTLLKVELLKIYSRKIQFNLFHSVLLDIFPDIYQWDVDFSPEDDIDLSYIKPIEFTGSTLLKELNDPKESHTLFPHKSANKSDKFSLAPTELDIQCNTSHIPMPTDKLCKNSSESICQSKSASVGKSISSNCNSSLNVGDSTTKSTSSFDDNKCKRKLDRVKRQNNYSVEDSNTASQKATKYNSVVRTSDDYSKQPDSNNCPDTKDSAVRRKRLYSIQNDITSENSMVLSPKEEKQTLDESLPKKPSVNQKNDFIFNAKNVKCRKATKNIIKPFRLFSSAQNSDGPNQVPSPKVSNKEQYKCVFSDELTLNHFDDKVKAHDEIPQSTHISSDFSQDIFTNQSIFTTKKDHTKNTYSNKNKRKKMNRFASLSPCTSDSDYKPTSCRETKFKVENKKMLRTKNKLTNARDSIEHNLKLKTNNDKNSSSPKKSKKYKPSSKINKSQTTTSATELPHADYLPAPERNKNNFLLKEELMKSPSFVTRISLSRTVEPIRDESHCSDIEVKAVQPEATDILHRQITLFEPECQIEGQFFDPSDLDQCVDLKDIATHNKLFGSKCNLESISLEKSLNTWNVVNEISVEVHNESLFDDVNLLQTSCKVEDILEFSQKSVLNLRNNIETSLIQYQEERQQNMIKYNSQLQTSRNYVLEHCEKLESNCRKMEKYKAILNDTINVQQDLISKIQSEMATLEKAKEELFEKESQARKSETSSIINLFKGVGTYIRRLLFTSYHRNALTTSYQNQTDRK